MVAWAGAVARADQDGARRDGSSPGYPGREKSESRRLRRFLGILFELLLFEWWSR